MLPPPRASCRLWSVTQDWRNGCELCEGPDLAAGVALRQTPHRRDGAGRRFDRDRARQESRRANL